MTREEAIEILKTDSCVDCGVGSQSPCTCTFDGYCDIKDAMEMAIKSLEQEPCEDAVSRTEIIDGLNRLGRNAFKDDTDYDSFFAFLDSLLPVTPTRKKGKWITKFHGFPPEPYTACSNCDYDIDFEISKLVKADAFTIKPYRPKFCPNCGAEMRGNENEAD